MTIQIDLANGSWQSGVGSYARGSATRGSTIYDANGLIGIADQQSSAEQFMATVSDLNGYFGLIRKLGDTVVAAVDRVRSIPLFYSVCDNALYISDRAEWIQKQIRDGTRDPVAEVELLLAGYVTGEDTLNPKVRQIVPGHILQAQFARGRWTCRQEPYFVYRPSNSLVLTTTERTWLKSLDEVTEEVIERLIVWASGRTIVVPLSGGMDSRMIVLMLKQLGHRNVITYTYGRPGNTEARISKHIADDLGYRWEFVPYSNEMWQTWSKSAEYEAYTSAAGNLSSLPHLQDWPAVGELRRRGVIPDDAVFVPGHTGDMISGGHIPLDIASSRYVSHDLVLDTIVNRNYLLWDWIRIAPGLGPLLVQRALRVIEGMPLDQVQNACSAIEMWNWRERQSKYIVNSVRVYEFYGHDWWMPYWDKSFIRFWSGVPLCYKLEAQLWSRYVREQGTALLRTSTLRLTESGRYGLRRIIASRLRRSTMTIKLGRKLQRNLRQQLKRIGMLAAQYDRHPMAWYGLIPRDQFVRAYTGRETIRSFMALAELGYSTFAEAYTHLRPRLEQLKSSSV